MPRRHWAGSASASVLVLFLGAASAFGQPAATIDSTLGVPLPEQPELRILKGDAPIEHLDVPALPEVTVKVEPEHADEPAMVTGTVSPSARPEAAVPALEAPTAPASTPGVDDGPVVLDIPEIELPPSDPALVPAAKPEPAPQPEAPVPLRAAQPPETVIPPPDLPKVVVELPVPGPLVPEITEHAAAAVALQRLPERERGEILAAYQANGNKPFWIDGKGWSETAKLLVARLERSSEDGLRPTDYALPVFEASDKVSLAEADIRLSALAVLYARDARGGRIDPRRLSKLITPTLYLPTATEVLSELTAVKDPGVALAAYNPPHQGYLNLKAKLAELRKHQDDTPMVRIPAGPELKLGMRDDRVHLVRARLGLGPSQEPVFDRSTSTAVAEFQKQAGLRANGILSPQTIAALGTPVTARQQQDIIAQMERWRWLPPDLGERHIIVNVPEYQVRVFDHGKIVHQARVIVGKPDSATPIFSHKMDHVIVNPSWFVPPSILKKEFLPGLAADPEYAAKRGYVVTRRGNSISVRQPPGERNALGWIKFMFPNEHAVYLHDTPNRRLFAAEKRAFSHGCVRVDNPFLLADQVLGPQWTTERLKRLIGSGERMIKLPAPLPIHLVYNTIVVDNDGRVTSFDDLYGFHRLVRQALEQRADASAAPAAKTREAAARR
ncbi:L,D-transpeptidase family protein [Bosea sp. BK604]|uniref:L,D-transpeptidase family protein n=1 Tax=Bosea sp. BK604 TaxID=2512180 RepID=UPI0010E8E0F6|nr:L,D-transpeptidase family protein [Bosea sp. BK604]TCR70603.1 murein L,D-transpeptidase YcbB/YkuD [Bosea sp. BK604]